MELDETFFGDTAIYALKTQFEDIDAGGVVHHPTYLKFYERARCDFIEKRGFPYDQMVKAGVALAVAEAYLSYRKPIRMYQTIYIVSRPIAFLRSNFKVSQAIYGTRPSAKDLQEAGNALDRIPDLLHCAELRLVCVSLDAIRPVSIPKPLLRALGVEDEDSLAKEAREVRIRS